MSSSLKGDRQVKLGGGCHNSYYHILPVENGTYIVDNPIDMKYYLGKMKLLLVAVAIVLAGLVFTWLKLFGNLHPQQSSLENQAAGSISTVQKYKADLTVDYGNGKVTSYENIEINEGDSAYSLLVKKMNETGSSVTTKSYGFGLMVESINTVLASQDHYWAYSVNGQMGSVAADKYILKNADKVEWKYTPLQR